MFCKNNKAFTLAEVLVTLTIIGVIASLTIPSLKETADRSANAAALQKAYSTASNAFAQLQAEYGSPIYWRVPLDAKNIATSMRDKRVFTDGNDQPFAWMLKRKMNVAAEKGIPPESYQIKKLSGAEFSKTEEKIDDTLIYLNDRDGKVSFQTADNMYWFPSHTYSGCQYTKNSTGQIGKVINVCGYLMVDTNGAKGPNRMGMDVFVFDVTTTGVFPYTTEQDDCKDMSGNGYGCAAKVLAGDEHALDFIYD